MAPFQKPLPGSEPGDNSASSGSAQDPNFEHLLREAEQQLQNLKDRYTQVQTGHQAKIELQQRLEQLQTEVSQVKEELDHLEITLESRLLSWDAQEGFWQVVRLGGLGLVVGFLLKSCVS